MNPDTKLGMIGIGLMGHGIAKNLLQKGFTLTFLDHPGNQSVEDLLQLGAKQADSCEQVAARSDVVLICVTGSPQAQSVLLGDKGIVQGLRPKSVVIDCSTIEPHVTPQLAQAVQACDCEYLDAPLTRTPKEAEAGRANTMVGGNPETFARLRPIFDAYCENVYHAGAVGSGHAMKLLHNFISLGNCLLLAEAVTCAQKCGIAREKLLEILTSGGGDSTALKRLTPYLLEGDSNSFRFSLGNSKKDLGYYKNFAEHLGTASHMASAAAAMLEAAVRPDDAARPLPELIDLLLVTPGRS